MTRGNDLRTLGELDDRHLGRQVTVHGLTGTLCALLPVADRIQVRLLVKARANNPAYTSSAYVFTDALGADEHVEVWRRTGGAA